MTERRAERFWAFPRANDRRLRRFGMSMGCLLGAIALWEWHTGETERIFWWGGGAFFLGASGLFLPRLLGPVFGIWMYAARILGWLNTHLLLGLVFYTLFTGVGGVMRLMHRDPLDRKIESERRSYWLKRSQTISCREHYERQF